MPLSVGSDVMDIAWDRLFFSVRCVKIGRYKRFNKEVNILI